MWKWSAIVAVPGGAAWKGKAGIATERKLSFRGDEVLPLQARCRVYVLLPEGPGGRDFRPVSLECRVSNVVIGGKGVQLDMRIENVSSEDLPRLREHCSADAGPTFAAG